MPEYLAPGVYVEETSFRSKSIEGVSTSTAGFVGPTAFGPLTGQPELLTSFADFERIYGGMYDLNFSDQPMTNYLAHAVRAFFEEGGKRLYVSRVFGFNGGVLTPDVDGVPASYARWPEPSSPPASLFLAARFPGEAGNIRVQLTFRVGTNALVSNPPPGGSGPTLTRVQNFDVVHIRVPESSSPPGSPPALDFSPFPLSSNGLHVAHWNAIARRWELRDGTGTPLLLSQLPLGPQGAQVRTVSIVVEIAKPNISTQGLPGFDAPILLGEFGLDGRSANGLTKTFTLQPSTRLQALTAPFTIGPADRFDWNNPQMQSDQLDQLTLDFARELLATNMMQTNIVETALLEKNPKPAELRRIIPLQKGNDGQLPTPFDYAGDPSEPFHDYINDPLQLPKRGLVAFG